MKKRYPIDKSFGIFSHFRLPSLPHFWLPVANAALSLVSKGGRGVAVRRVNADGVRVFLISPEEAEGKLPCLVYFHGGGFGFHAAQYHYRNAAEYARTGCRVLFVDYRLAPKHPYPEPNDDCYTAYRWVTEHASEYAIDPARLAVGGDSAGGCLAADVVRRAEEEGLPKPVFLMLVYPVLDRRMQTRSMAEYSDTPVWNARLNAKMWAYYLAGREYASPSEWTDLGCFPPAYLETAEFDCLHDEGVAFAVSLRARGNYVMLRETKGAMHGYDFVRKSPLTKESLAARCEVLRTVFKLT